jgi:hypothetical protein
LLGTKSDKECLLLSGILEEENFAMARLSKLWPSYNMKFKNSTTIFIFYLSIGFVVSKTGLTVSSCLVASKLKTEISNRKIYKVVIIDQNFSADFKSLAFHESVKKQRFKPFLSKFSTLVTSQKKCFLDCPFK